jgi:hypothetical protein
LVPAAAAAGALAVLVLLAELVLLDPESDELAGVLDEEALLLLAPPLELPSFLVELYRSEYQPPPLRTKLERLTTLLSVPCAPHAVQDSGVGSLTFWRTSIIFPQD